MLNVKKIPQGAYMYNSTIKKIYDDKIKPFHQKNEVHVHQ